MKLISVHDVKAKAFLQIATVRTPGEGIRQFESVCRDPKTQFAQFPSDFVLVELADYDELTGIITPHETHRILATASEFIQ